jgi:hypothetical protein
VIRVKKHSSLLREADLLARLIDIEGNETSTCRFNGVLCG